MAYCLQGLAVIHVLTVGLAGRLGVLSGIYFALVMIPGWPALVERLGLGAVEGLAGQGLPPIERRVDG